MRLASVPSIACALLVGCNAPVSDAEPPSPDRCAFERDVYPVLARDCGFPACHGDPDRFFQVWAPGRTRLDPAHGPFTPATVEEIDRTFDRARAMLAMSSEPSQALLLRKPLEESSGGAAHMGVDAYGRNVYASPEAPGYQAIAAWARGESGACP